MTKKLKINHSEMWKYLIVLGYEIYFDQDTIEQQLSWYGRFVERNQITGETATIPTILITDLCQTTK